MKRTMYFLGLSLAAALVAALSWNLVAVGQEEGIEVFSDGADGAFEPGGPREVNLATAATGDWNADPHPSPGRGIYDPQKWAVVFRYSSVDIPPGVTVRFKNHPSRAPVVWLVDGDVTISGDVILDGAPGHRSQDPFRPSEPGPGGFRGGIGGIGQNPPSGGFGPGGGASQPNCNQSHSVKGTYNYGRSGQILPLIGGSGGGGSTCGGGGAGGGAILIAARGTITVNGTVRANGGDSGWGGNWCYGSGGAIRLIGNAVVGDGQLEATSLGGSSYYGRTRVEGKSVTLSQGQPPYVVAVTGDTALVWPPEAGPSKGPKIRVARISNAAAGDQDVPLDPRASFEFPSADISVDSPEAVTLRIEAENVPGWWAVDVRVTTALGPLQTYPATFVSGDQDASVWTAEFTPAAGFSAIQVHAHE